MKLTSNPRQLKGLEKLSILNETSESNDMDYNQNQIEPIKDKPSAMWMNLMKPCGADTKFDLFLLIYSVGHEWSWLMLLVRFDC